MLPVVRDGIKLKISFFSAGWLARTFLYALIASAIIEPSWGWFA